jgi:hypothetical protein
LTTVCRENAQKILLSNGSIWQAVATIAAANPPVEEK